MFDQHTKAECLNSVLVGSCVSDPHSLSENKRTELPLKQGEFLQFVPAPLVIEEIRAGKKATAVRARLCEVKT